jgi:hypothetical protein
MEESAARRDEPHILLEPPGEVTSKKGALHGVSTSNERSRWSDSCSRRPQGVGLRCRSMGPTTPRPTRPPSGPTSTSKTLQGRTCSSSKGTGEAKPGEHKIYNLGNGAGFAVKEVVKSAREGTRVRGRRSAEAGRGPGGAGGLEPQDPRATRLGAQEAGARHHNFGYLGWMQAHPWCCQRPTATTFR